jgi:hypothetical protein
MKKKIKGIYLRGKVFWFARQVKGKRIFVSLETSDYDEAVARAYEVIDAPDLIPSEGIEAEIPRFVAFKTSQGLYSKMSAGAKENVLQLFATHVNNISPAKVSVEQCQAFYDGLKNRGDDSVRESTAQSYVMTIQSFFGWCVNPGSQIGARLGP